MLQRLFTLAPVALVYRTMARRFVDFALA